MKRRLALCIFASCAALASSGLHAEENVPGAALPGEGSAPKVAAKAPPARIPERLQLIPLVGLGRIDSTLPAGASSDRFLYGLGITYRIPSVDTELRLAVLDDVYQRTYLSTQPGLNGGLHEVEVEEHAIRSELVGYYNVMPAFGAPDLFGLGVSIGPYGGVYYTHYVNEVYPAPLVGPLLGLEMGLWPADALRVTGGVDYTFNVGQVPRVDRVFRRQPDRLVALPRRARAQAAAARRRLGGLPGRVARHGARPHPPERRPRLPLSRPVLSRPWSRPR